jgi:RNA polymerase sigma factor (sigma-70 family)
MIGDGQLLRRYVEERSEPAFAELVNRHVSLVYHAALRRVGGDAHLADDVTQSVFVDLARKAGALKGRPMLAGWLHTSTRFAASQAVRAEQRRRTREQEAQSMRDIDSGSVPQWHHLGPVIDSALDDLDRPEREVLLLRFFEYQSFAEMGEGLSLSSDAARMRVDRALAKLRGKLAKRGITSSSAALATVLSAQSGAAAPAGLASTILAKALAEAATTSTATIGMGTVLSAVTLCGIGFGVALYEMGSGGNARTDAASVTGNGIVATSNAGMETGAKDSASPPLRSSQPLSASKLGAFANFPPRQRGILRRLWEIARSRPPDGSPVHVGIKFSGDTSDSQNFIEFEGAVAALESDGLVAVGIKKGVVFLTDDGIVYCEAHKNEIEANSQ